MFLTLYLDIELHSIFWRYIASTAFYRYEGIKKKTFLLDSPIYRLKKPSKLRANLRKTNLFLCKKVMNLSLWTIPNLIWQLRWEKEISWRSQQVWLSLFRPNRIHTSLRIIISSGTIHMQQTDIQWIFLEKLIIY